MRRVENDGFDHICCTGPAMYTTFVQSSLRPFAILVLHITGEFLGSWPTTEISYTRKGGRPFSSPRLRPDNTILVHKKLRRSIEGK